jgi:hypothetical protein
VPQLKVEILLPLHHNPDKNGVRRKIDGNEFSDTYKDLVNQFDGCTINPAPQSGGWINPDTRKEVQMNLSSIGLFVRKLKKINCF